MKRLIRILMLAMCALTAVNSGATPAPDVVEKVITDLTGRYPDHGDAVAAGVRQVARLWTEADGSDAEFAGFCAANFIADEAQRTATFLKISEYIETINGYFNEMTLGLQRNLHEDTGELLDIDKQFGAYNPASHFTDDMYANKIAFAVALNFAQLSLDRKEQLGDNRLAWAEARLGDVFAYRVPADVQQHVSDILAAADIYISDYNIYMGNLLTSKGKTLFPADMRLLCHWNLRDEIKANYGCGAEGVEKQRIIYDVMRRVVDQSIPVEVINSNRYQWNPTTNALTLDGKPVEAHPETNVRYSRLLDNFHAEQLVDRYCGNTAIDRNFNEDMEISVDRTEAIFRQYLSAPEMKQIGELIAKRLGRKLAAYDIWYDGFKARSTMNEDELSALTRAKYPNAEALNAGLPEIFTKLGFSAERAAWLSERITVDAARGSGHAWGAEHRRQQSHLRTRIPATGMDYKGYNIAIHEFGHNVEQTISLYDVDYFMLHGVPNTAFTEALAFVFQKKDLQILGFDNADADKARLDVLDAAWSMYEICGVSLLDISVWKWMYAHPDATADQLRDAVITLAKDIWNEYYAPVFGTRDETVLAIYSHAICYPLYLSAYAFGQIIQFQLENYFEGRNFADEVTRIYRLGRLTPNEWMRRATNSDLSVEPMLRAASQALSELK
ncbi:MAG: hypothetical protein ACI31A_04835 [Candidatus Limisoma sp.]